MAKNDKAIYAPGELSRVREKLGVFDKEEADQLIKKLGGEIGYERAEESEQARQQVRRERVNVKIGDRPSRPSRNRDRLPLDDNEDTLSEAPAKVKAARKKEKEMDAETEDDPSVPLRVAYWDRIKMDKFAGQSEFEVKSSAQVFQSMISLFGDVPDYVSHIFVTRRMPEYYKRLEGLVISTRTLFPRNNMRRNERMKKSAPLAYSILDVIRYWDIEKVSSDLNKIQSHAKSARVSDFANILRAIYRPLFTLDRLDLDVHIRGAYKVLYKLLYIENPTEAENKYQELIRTALSAFSGIRQNIRYLLFPLLLKSVSANYVPYEQFFTERKNRLMSFLNTNEDNQINPAAVGIQGDAKDLKPEAESKAAPAEGQDTPEEEISEEEKARRAAAESEKKALDRGLRTLEVLFPKAGWDRLSSYPDLFPYFADIFSMKKGVVNIAPTDPMQQVLILMHTLEELFFAVRHISFGAIPDQSGSIEELNTTVGAIINNWRYYIETSFGKDYVPKLLEYVRVLEGSLEERSSMYNKKLITELHWLKRLYFLPFYKFESLIPPPFQKGEVKPIYSEIKSLRKYFSAVAAGIERGNRAGGAEAQALCDGIDNPWEPYVFEVPNPLSRRMDALLAPKGRNNASLVYFTLAVTTVLDYILNNEKSWAYNSRPGPLFRSVNGEGLVPLTGIDNRIDANELFKQSLKQRQKGKDA